MRSFYISFAIALVITVFGYLMLYGVIDIGRDPEAFIVDVIAYASLAFMVFFVFRALRFLFNGKVSKWGMSRGGVGYGSSDTPKYYSDGGDGGYSGVGDDCGSSGGGDSGGGGCE
uniref:hypothetical protein n=1 Tax=Thaumasiovibrio occultus TaxID=1891184 RepID=UPI000B361164|nr:hypothetical protein [Thaumasiovibrio occultus]